MHDEDGCARIELFLRHTQWDHIKGFPFFSPIYDPESRITVDGNEPFRNPFSASTDVDRIMMQMADISAREGNRRIEASMAKTDILVHDAPYTEAEYAANRTGWGHTSMEQAVASAGRAGVGDLVLFHHDPSRTDEDLDRLDRHLRKAAAGPGLGVRFAMEG